MSIFLGAGSLPVCTEALSKAGIPGLRALLLRARQHLEGPASAFRDGALEVKVARRVLFSEFVGFLSRNRNAPFVGLCMQSRAEPCPFTRPCADSELKTIARAFRHPASPQEAHALRAGLKALQAHGKDGELGVLRDQEMPQRPCCCGLAPCKKINQGCLTLFTHVICLIGMARGTMGKDGLSSLV